MIEFSDNKPIYRQIVDHACNLIMEGLWAPGEKIPSVRELSAELGVNSRTVLKAMEELQDLKIIFARRGLGFSLSADAPEIVRSQLRNEFFETTLPKLENTMKLLGISTNDLLLALRHER